jgi:hypothetical protein
MAAGSPPVKVRDNRIARVSPQLVTCRKLGTGYLERVDTICSRYRVSKKPDQKPGFFVVRELRLSKPGLGQRESRRGSAPKRVLILDPFKREVAPYSAVVSAFRNPLVREFGRPVDRVEDIRQAQPQTTHIVVVFGAYVLERFWVNERKRAFRVGFPRLNDLSSE